MGNGRGVPAATLLLLVLQLLTHRSVTCTKVENKSTTSETKNEDAAPSTQKILVEEIILAGGVNNSEIPGDTIIEDPGKTKEKILSHLVRQDDGIRSKRQDRANNKDLTKAPTNTLIINVADMKDLENLEHILAASEYEPRKIQSKKIKRKISQDSAIQSKIIDSSTEEATTTTTATEKFVYELPRKHRLRKKKKELEETTKSPAASSEKSLLISRESQGQRSTENSKEKNDFSTTPAVTTQRVKRKLKTDDVGESSEDAVTPIPYLSLLAAVKNPSRRAKNSANLSTGTRSRNTASPTSSNSVLKEPVNNTLILGNPTVSTSGLQSSSTANPRIVKGPKETEPTAFATLSNYAKTIDFAKNPDVIPAKNNDESDSDFTTVATKKKKRRKVPQHNYTSHVNVLDNSSNGLQKNENLTSNLAFLTKHDMIPRPFSVANGPSSSLGVTGSASESSQVKVQSPVPEVKIQFGKTSVTNTPSENLTPLPILEVTRNPYVLLNPQTKIPGLRSNFYPTLSPVVEETQNVRILQNNFDAKSSPMDLPKSKVDPVAAFVNDLTSMSFGNTAKIAHLSGSRNADNTAKLNNYVNQQEFVSPDLFNINDNPAVISLLALPRTNSKIHAAASFNNLAVNPEVYKRTLEPIKQANEYYLQPIQKLPATIAPILQRQVIEGLQDDLGRSVNPEIYTNFAETTIPSTQESLVKVTSSESSEEPVKLASYEDLEKSRTPEVESYEDYDGSLKPKFIPTNDQNVLDPYVTSTSQKNVISRASFPPASNRAYSSTHLATLPARTILASSTSKDLRSRNEDQRKLNRRSDDEDSSESPEDANSSEEIGSDYRSDRARQQAEINRQAYKVHEAPEEDGVKERADLKDYDENNSRDTERVDHQEERYEEHPHSEKRHYRDKYGHDKKQDYGNDSREKRKREYQDQKQERSERHHKHDHAAKDDKHKDKKFEKGGGAEFEEVHHSAEGTKGEKAYESEHEHEKQEKGHHDKEQHSNHYAEEDGDASKHHEEGGYHKEQHQEEKGEKKSQFEEKGEHKKGHSTKGAHVVHKKDEFEKKTEFFDEFHEDSDMDKEGEFHHEHAHEKGGHEKHHKLESAEHEEGHGKKGEHMKGGHHDEYVGHEVKEDQDHRHEHEEKHGKKAGQEKGEKWAFKKRDGGGDQKKKGDE